MDTWTKALCKQFIKKSEKIFTVEKFGLTQTEHKLTLLCSPSIQLEFDEIHKDPFIVAASEKDYDEICIQLDPSKTFLRTRHFLRNSMELTVNTIEFKDTVEYELPIVRDLNELKTNLEVSYYLKSPPNNHEDSVSNIISNILNKNFLNYPFLASSLIYTLLKNENCFLIDIPEALLSINIANQLNLSDLKEIYSKVLDEYRYISEDSQENELTSSEITHNLYPEIFQKPRDQFTLSVLQKKLFTSDVLAVVSAPTYLAIKKKWNEKIDFGKVNKITPRKPEDSDEVLVEKHAILDALLGGKSWGDKFMFNRFPYIDKKENIDKDRKSLLQGMFHSKYLQYFSPIDDVKKKLDKQFKEFTESGDTQHNR